MADPDFAVPTLNHLQEDLQIANIALDIVSALVVIMDRQGRIVRFNRTCEEITGYRFEQVQGRHVWDVFLVPEEVDGVKRVFDQLAERGIPQQAENHWLTKDGDRRLVAWTNSTLLDENAQVKWVIATGVDITEQRQAEADLHEANELLEARVQERTKELAQANRALLAQVAERERAEQQLQERVDFEELVTAISSNFISLSPEEIDEGIANALQAIGEFAQVDRSYLFRFWGDNTMSNTHEWCAEGIAPQMPRLARLPMDVLAWSNAQLRQGRIVHIPDISALPDEAAPERAEFARQGTKSLIAVPLIYRDETLGLIGFDSVRARKTWAEDGIRLLRIVGGIIANALEHKRALERQAAQNRFLELLATGAGFSTTLHSLVEVIEEQWPGMEGLILLLDKDRQHLHYGAAVSLPQEYLDSIEGLKIGPLVGSCGTASHCKKRVIVEDIAVDPRWDGLRSLALKYGFRACWSEPVISSEGEVVATFAMYYRSPRAPTEDELRTIEMAAHLVGVAVEFKEAQDALKESQERFQAAAESANDLIYELDPVTGKLEWFGNIDAKLGYPTGHIPHTLEGFMRTLHPDDHDRVLNAIKRHLATHEPFHEEYRLRDQDGDWRYWDDRGTAFWDEQDHAFKMVGACTDITERIHAYQMLEQRVEERTRELRTLLNVLHNVTSTLELQPLLELILDQLRSVVDYTGASVMALQGNALSVVAYRGVIAQEQALQIRFSLDKDSANRQVITEKRPIIISDTRQSSSEARSFQVSVKQRPDVPLGYIASWMGVPLIAHDTVIGMLSFDHSQPNHYTERHAALVMAFANEAAIAIENAQLYEQAQELAAVEERQRLARELHDSVTQSLYGVTLYAEAAARLLSGEQRERAEEYLHTLGVTAREALREMRLLIFELRPPLLEKEGLVNALRARLEAVEGRAGLQVHLDAQENLHLPVEVEKEIYRIVQEALNNVLKHSEARSISIELRRTKDTMWVQVTDDGIGFDLRQDSYGMGLPGMRERVELLHGQLELESAPGEGTCVKISVPVGHAKGELT